MQKKENLDNIKNEEVSVFINGLLYGIYSVISNKTVRVKEKFLKRWYNRNPEIPGEEMIKTNRGYFIDGYNVDQRSVDLWFYSTKLNRNKHVRKSKD